MLDSISSQPVTISQSWAVDLINIMAEVNFFKALALILLSSFLRSNFVLGADSYCSLYYSNSSDSYDVYCNQVPMSDIKKQFNDKTPIKIRYLELKVQTTGDFIPADPLGQSQLTGELKIYTQDSEYDGSIKPLLVVHPNAFRSSRNTTLRRVEVRQFQGIPLDLSFLAGFDNVQELYIYYIENLNLTTLPAFPSLTMLNLHYNTGINEAFQDVVNLTLQTSQGLNYFSAYYCEMNTNGLANLLDWVLLPSSSETVKKLAISGNSISSIPEQLSSFRSIEYLIMQNNMRSLTIGNSSIYYDPPEIPYFSTIIDMKSSGLKSVESDAFQGNYSSAKVDLSGNSLTRFEEGAFKSMLEDMSLMNANGFLNVEKNPFDCYSDQCQHLNWLIRDNRHLLDKLTNARCILDGTAFEDLTQSLCDAFGITSTTEPTKKTEKPDSNNAIALSPISNILFSFFIPVAVLLLDSLF